ncbi:hypothetical protein PP713_13990 [Mycobacterium sp. CSUR Q5927]|nr:hypothetical protein [Mycobacterium sp. CSUR Q5927]
MSEHKFYPKRTDHVFAVPFDGTIESAQRISQAAGRDAELLVRPSQSIGDRPREMRVGGHIVAAGSYVVCDQSKNIIEVVDGWDFRDRYSSDGL